MREDWACSQRMSEGSLCSNPDCSNRNISFFEEKHICAEDESTEIMLCKVCGTETPKSEWDAKCQQLFPVKTRDRKLKVSPTSEPKEMMDSSGIDISQEDIDISTAVLQSLQLDSCETVVQNSQLPREVSTESLSALISQTGCPKCSVPLQRVQGCEQDMLTWYCVKCDVCTGVDDSFTDGEVYAFVKHLADCLQSNTLKIEYCAGRCGNDDPNQFVLEIDVNRLVMKCNKCKHKEPIPFEEDEDLDNAHEADVYQIQCDCGNNDPSRFTVLYHPVVKVAYKVECRECHVELIFDPELARDDDKTQSASGNENTFQPPVGNAKVNSVTELQKADHISWHQKWAYWHHAIVDTVGKISGKVKVIHYNGPDKQYGGKGVIKEEWLDIDLKKEDLYRNKYDDCHPPDVVLERAKTRLGEAKYSLWGNNCEHFCQWCKTGIAKSCQVESFAETLLTIKEKIAAYAGKDSVKQSIRAVKFISSKARSFKGSLKGSTAASVTLSPTAVTRNLGKASTAMAKEEAKAAASGLSKLDYAVMGVVVAIEGYRTCRDINQMHKKKQEGNITHNEFLRFTIKRTSQGVGGATGTVAGGVIGQMLIPIPVLGSVAGASVGAFLGEGIGTLLGRKCATVVNGK